MKRIVIITVSVVVLCLCLAFAGIHYAVEAYQQSYLSPQMGPVTFGSFEDFEAQAKGKATKDSSEGCYYVPSKLPVGFEFTEIRMREDIYITVDYRLKSDDISVKQTDSYAEERLNTLICQYSLYSDGEAALKNTYIPNGFEPFEYKGKTYYRFDEILDGKTFGYELVFLEEGHLIYLHLPAIDTFENMMTYAEVKKVEIK